MYLLTLYAVPLNMTCNQLNVLFQAEETSPLAFLTSDGTLQRVGPDSLACPASIMDKIVPESAEGQSKHSTSIRNPDDAYLSSSAPKSRAEYREVSLRLAEASDLSQVTYTPILHMATLSASPE
jgi:hypothetical protein